MPCAIVCYLLAPRSLWVVLVSLGKAQAQFNRPLPAPRPDSAMKEALLPGSVPETEV